MRELAILIFQTMDGVMQAPSLPEEDPSGGFDQGGWARECWDEVMEQVGRLAMAEPYDLLLGRNTYDLFTASFAESDPDNAVALRLNRATKYVVTSGEDELRWQNSVKLDGRNLAREISELKRTEGPLLQVHGSWQLVQALHQHRLIDELRLWTFPVVVGKGKRLFAEATTPGKYELVALEPCSSGAFVQIYRPLTSTAE